MKNYWLNRKKEREEKAKKSKAIYPKSLWTHAQKILNSRKATGP